MSVSARTQYACLAVLELALRHESGRPTRVREIAAAHDIPAAFLTQILLQLKTAGVVTSTRGASGGYRLRRDPEDVTLGEVMVAVGESPLETTANPCDATPPARALRKVWRRATSLHRRLLDSTSFADLVAEVREPAEHMFYI